MKGYSLYLEEEGEPSALTAIHPTDAFLRLG